MISGVEAQTLTVWQQANRYKIPRIIFLNKMDKFGANFSNCLKSIKERLNVDPVPINLPIGKEKTFSGIVDLVTLEQKIWDLDKSPNGTTIDSEKIDFSVGDLSTEMVLEERASLIGHLAEYDEVIAGHVLNDVKVEEIPTEDIINALRNMTLKNQNAVIVLCGSSKRNIGVQPLIDAVVNYLPCPSDIKHNFLEYYGDHLCALAFKIVHDKHRGALTYVRIYGGTLKCSGSIYNVNLKVPEKIGRQDLLQVNADHYSSILEAGPGNIVCLSELKEVCLLFKSLARESASSVLFRITFY